MHSVARVNCNVTRSQSLFFFLKPRMLPFSSCAQTITNHLCPGNNFQIQMCYNRDNWFYPVVSRIIEYINKFSVLVFTSTMNQQCKYLFPV